MLACANEQKARVPAGRSGATSSGVRTMFRASVPPDVKNTSSGVRCRPVRQQRCRAVVDHSPRGTTLGMDRRGITDNDRTRHRSSQRAPPGAAVSKRYDRDRCVALGSALQTIETCLEPWAGASSDETTKQSGECRPCRKARVEIVALRGRGHVKRLTPFRSVDLSDALIISPPRGC